MKKLIATVFMLSLVLLCQFLWAQDADLDGAITRLWSTGPDEKIEQILKTCSESNVPAVATRANFHLACLRALKDSANAEPILAQLEIAAQNETEKATIKTLREMLQARANKLPDSFQKKISLDFKDVDLAVVAQIIAKQSNTNIVVHSKIKKMISITLLDATIAQALDLICEMTDLRYENRNGVFVILPMQEDSKNYVKSSYRLSSLSPTKAINLLELHARAKTGGNAPANFADNSGNAESELPPGVTTKVDSNKIIFEGEPEAVARYLSFLESMDLKDRAHKISFRVWQLNQDSSLDIRAFADLDENERGKVAKIVSAPAIIALPNKLARIAVDNADSEKTDPPKESLDYSISCRFNDTYSPDHLNITFEIQVYGTSVIHGKPLKTTKAYNTRINVKRNEWVMLPFYQGANLIYLETQVTSHTD
ncbi:MAG: hypothetical protein A2W80_13070 [Candidatus Riflebacteria bacterium GWC2_50_8]|nr:MAG: hypothetical protein A2W80_13070 [Candidatus Riflebacteria bacterium GWC2_50_8]